MHKQHDETPLSEGGFVIGKGRLVSLVDAGLPFIETDDFVPEHKQHTYRNEKWNAEVLVSNLDKYAVGKTYLFTFKVLEAIGLTSSKSPKDLKTSTLADRFIVFNGIEIY